MCIAIAAFARLRNVSLGERTGRIRNGLLLRCHPCLLGLRGAQPLDGVVEIRPPVHDRAIELIRRHGQFGAELFEPGPQVRIGILQEGQGALGLRQKEVRQTAIAVGLDEIRIASDGFIETAGRHLDRLDGRRQGDAGRLGSLPGDKTWLRGLQPPGQVIEHLQVHGGLSGAKVARRPLGCFRRRRRRRAGEQRAHFILENCHSIEI